MRKDLIFSDTFSARQKENRRDWSKIKERAGFPRKVNRASTPTLSGIWPRLWAIPSRCKSKAFRYVLVHLVEPRRGAPWHELWLAAIKTPSIFDQAERICIPLFLLLLLPYLPSLCERRRAGCPWSSVIIEPRWWLINRDGPRDYEAQWFIHDLCDDESAKYTFERCTVRKYTRM